MKKTTHMRVPIKFKDTVERIAVTQKRSMLDILEKDGITIFENSEYITKMTNFFRRKRK